MVNSMIIDMGGSQVITSSGNKPLTIPRVGEYILRQDGIERRVTKIQYEYSDGYDINIVVLTENT